jgi:hypothetical protein
MVVLAGQARLPDLDVGAGHWSALLVVDAHRQANFLAFRFDATELERHQVRVATDVADRVKGAFPLRRCSPAARRFGESGRADRHGSVGDGAPKQRAPTQRSRLVFHEVTSRSHRRQFPVMKETSPRHR